MIDERWRTADMNLFACRDEDPELKDLLRAWGEPQTPSSLNARLKASYRHELNRNAFAAKHFFYWALGFIIIGTGASLLWLAARNSAPAPTVAEKPAVPAKMPVAASTEPVPPPPRQSVVPIGPPKVNNRGIQRDGVNIAGKWYLTQIDDDEAVVPSHRVDFIFYKEGNGYRGAVLLRSGEESPLASMEFDGSKLRLQLKSRSGQPQHTMPWLVVSFVNNRFEGHYCDSANTPLGPKLKLVRWPE